MRVVCLTFEIVAALWLWPAGVYAQSEAPMSEALREAYNRGVQLYQAGQYEQAVPLLRQAVGLGEQEVGAEHRLTAVMLSYLGNAYRAQGRHREATPLHERALAILERVLGPADPELATTLSNLAVLYQEQGRQGQAEPLRKRALAIWEKSLGPDHPTVATALNRLAVLYQEQGRYAEAEPLHKRALAIQEQSLRPDHPDLAITLNNLGELYRAQGRYAEAEPLLEWVLAIWGKVAGPDRLAVARALNTLAALYQNQGRHAEAEPLYKEAQRIQEQSLDPNDPELATTLNNLAILYLAQGRYAEAEPLHKRALAIWEKSLGPDHPTVATALNSVAVLYQEQGRHTEAEPLHKRTLAIREKRLGPDQPDVATTLNSLAMLYQEQGRHAEAEPLHRRALAIREKSLGSDHPDVAISLNNLAKLYSAQGRHTEAEPLHKRALAIREKSLGPDHPDTAISFSNLAALYLAQGRHAEALDRIRKATAPFRGRAVQSALGRSAGGQAELANSQNVFMLHAVIATTLAATQPDQNTELLAESFEVVQLARATGTAAAVAGMAARFAAGDDALAVAVREQQDLVAHWRDLDAVLVDAIGRAPERRDRDLEAVLRDGLAEDDWRLDELDARLAREFPDYAALTAPTPLEATVAQALLRPGEALVAFLVDEDRSFAWVVRPGQALVMLPLAIGRDELTADIELLRIGFAGRGGRGVPARLAPEATELQTRGLDFHDGRSVVEMFDVDLAHRLYEQIWAPLEPHLAGVEHVLVVPDGALESLPLSVLVSEPPAEPGSELSQSEQLREVAWLAKRPYAISVLPAVRSLGALRDPKLAPNIMPGTRFIGFGDPQIGDLEATATCPEPGAPLVEMAALDRGADDAGKAEPAALYGGGFAGEVPVADVDAVRALPRLADSRCELQALAGSLGAGEDALHIGPAATEAAVKQLSEAGTLRRAGVLAFATHGLVAGELKGLAEPALVLTPPANGTAEDDGLLTASEVAQLDLNANWVLLSACNTASPDGSPGAEGLSGLARAFFYAGTRALLVSHWSVASPAAVALTTGTLARLQQQPRLGRAEALHRTMQDLIATGPNPNPAFWAPFTLVGEGAGAKSTP